MKKLTDAVIDDLFEISPSAARLCTAEPSSKFMSEERFPCETEFPQVKLENPLMLLKVTKEKNEKKVSKTWSSPADFPNFEVGDLLHRHVDDQAVYHVFVSLHYHFSPSYEGVQFC